MTYQYRNREYHIRDYTTEWKQLFETEAADIKSVFGIDALQIEHIGSTAVPGLAAKPTVDILVTVDFVEVADRYISQMEELGYKSLGAFINEDSRMFEREVDGNRLFIVHVFPQKHRHVLELIKTRDYLITHPEEAQAYASIKRELKEKFPDDYVAYSKAKNEYVNRLVERAMNS